MGWLVIYWAKSTHERLTELYVYLYEISPRRSSGARPVEGGLGLIKVYEYFGVFI